MSAATLPGSGQRADRARTPASPSASSGSASPASSSSSSSSSRSPRPSSPGSSTPANIQFVLVDTTVFALLALGETMVVISRNVDLSVGSVVGLSAYLSASLFRHHPGIPIPVVFLAGLGIGLACGVANGFMVAVGPGAEPGGDARHAVHHPRHRHPASSAATRWTRRRCPTRSSTSPRTPSPASPTSPSRSPWSSGSAPTTCAPTAPAGTCTRSAPTPRRPASPGCPSAGGCSPRSPSAAPSPASPACCGPRSTATINSTAGTGYELQVVSAVVVGGVAIFGGSGTATGAALGALLLTTINSALYVLGISSVLGPGDLGLPAARRHRPRPDDHRAPHQRPPRQKPGSRKPRAMR